MKKYKITFNSTRKGISKKYESILKTNYNGNDEETLFKRLNNNLKNWQNMYNKDRYKNDKIKFELISFEEIK